MRKLNWFSGSKVKELVNSKEGFKLEEGDKTFLGGVQLELEIAKNPKEGLSKRTSLCHNCGMVFFFDGEAHITTKETKLPLDIIFITENRIVKIITATPFGDQYMYPADTVIELNSGFCRDNNINVGDYLQVDKKRTEKQREEDLEQYMSQANYRVRYKKGGTVTHNVGGRLLKKVLSDSAGDTTISFFSSGPKTKNKQALKTLSDFKNRLDTPEGINRIKQLNLEDTDVNRLKNLDIIDNPKTVAHYNPWTKININPNLNPEFSNKITRHEIEHGVQGYTKSKIDLDLENLELKNPSKTNPYTIPEKELSTEEYKIRSSNPESYLKDKSTAADYFTWGSDGMEKAPFLAEVQEWAVDKKLINHPYDKVSPEKMKDMFFEYQFDKSYPIRIFEIMKPSKENFELLSKNFNRLLTLGAVTGTGIGLAETYKKGGKKKKLKSKIIRREGLAETSKTDILFQSPGDRRIEKKFKNAPMARYQDGGQQVEEPESPLVTKSEGTYLLDEKGGVQMVMQGNERIFSRIHTRKILALIKKIDDEKDPVKLEKLLENLGVLVADIILTHDTQEEEYTTD